MGSLVNSIKHLGRNDLFQNLEVEITLPSTFYAANITLISNPVRLYDKEDCRPTPPMNTVGKILNKTLAN